MGLSDGILYSTVQDYCSLISRKQFGMGHCHFLLHGKLCGDWRLGFVDSQLHIYHNMWLYFVANE